MDLDTTKRLTDRPASLSKNSLFANDYNLMIPLCKAVVTASVRWFTSSF